MEILRKSALAASLLDVYARHRLYASLPRETRNALRRQVSEVERRGWANRATVEALLGESFVQPLIQGDVGLDELLRLALHLEPVVYARVMQASELGDPEFLLSLLDDDYAARVRDALQSAAPMPSLLRAAALAAAREVLCAQTTTGAA